MSEQVTTDTPDPADIGSRIDPVLARSWLLVNGAHANRFQAARLVSKTVTTGDFQ